MKVLSLFDGMSCGQIALRELGIVPEAYYASEIDRHAIAQTLLNFPDTVQLGDVERWREWDIDWEGIDLVMGGSPCQGFSFAGKQLAFDDPRSRLFFVFAEILDYARSRNPRVRFLLENVNMKREYLRVISERVGVRPVNIKSALGSAQNRNRWYWTDIRTRREGLFGEVVADIPQPRDRGILLRDILEVAADEKYYLKASNVETLIRHDLRNKKKGNGFGSTFHSPYGKMGTLTKGGGGMYDLVCVRIVGRNPDNPSDRRKGIFLRQTIEEKPEGKTGTLTPVAKDNMIIQLNPSKESGGRQPYQQNRVYASQGKFPALAAGHGGQSPNVLSGVRIRRLTPTECARLQTVPDWYRWGCSATQQYRMLGNGWTVEVIKHILSFGKWN